MATNNYILYIITSLCQKYQLLLGLTTRKPVFGSWRTTKAQTSYASASLLFDFWKVSYLNLLQAKFQTIFKFLASLCSWGDWSESYFVGNPEDWFCRGEVQVMSVYKTTIMSHDMRFPTMWYARPAKAQTILRICAVWSEPLQVVWIFCDC